MKGGSSSGGEDCSRVSCVSQDLQAPRVERACVHTCVCVCVCAYAHVHERA